MLVLRFYAHVALLLQFYWTTHVILSCASIFGSSSTIIINWVVLIINVDERC